MKCIEEAANIMDILSTMYTDLFQKSLFLFESGLGLAIQNEIE